MKENATHISFCRVQYEIFKAPKRGVVPWYVTLFPVRLRDFSLVGETRIWEITGQQVWVNPQWSNLQTQITWNTPSSVSRGNPVPPTHHIVATLAILLVPRHCFLQPQGLSIYCFSDCNTPPHPQPWVFNVVQFFIWVSWMLLLLSKPVSPL